MENDIKTKLKDLLKGKKAKKIRESKRSIYYITTSGDLISETKKSGLIRKLSPQKNEKGYLIYRINKKNIKVHRLVVEAFASNYSPYLHVNHIDGNKLNNDISNLEMCTSMENINHYNVSKELDNWKVSIKDIRKAKELSTDKRNLLQVLDFHYTITSVVNDFPMIEVRDREMK